MNYSPLVQQHFFNPYHVGEWDVDFPNVLTAKTGSYALGAIVQLQCLVIDARVVEARFKAFGNPYLIAACSYITEWLEGKSLDEIAAFDYKELIQTLNLPSTQQHCAIIINSAIELLVK